jgi:hypothetical protein
VPQALRCGACCGIEFGQIHSIRYVDCVHHFVCLLRNAIGTVCVFASGHHRVANSFSTVRHNGFRSFFRASQSNKAVQLTRRATKLNQ